MKKVKLKNLAYLDDQKATESDRPAKELLEGMFAVILGMVILVIVACVFADAIDTIFNKYPIIPLVMCAPVIVWAGKRCYNRFVK